MFTFSAHSLMFGQSTPDAPPASGPVLDALTPILTGSCAMAAPIVPTAKAAESMSTLKLRRNIDSSQFWLQWALPRLAARENELFARSSLANCLGHFPPIIHLIS